MDKMTRYRELVKRLLSEWVARMNQPAQPGVETATIFDGRSDQYLIMSVGWRGSHRVRAITVHVRLHADKIWIEEDWTEQGFVTQLLAAGVTGSDIVLGFHAPEMRSHTELPLRDFRQFNGIVPLRDGL